MSRLRLLYVPNEDKDFRQIGFRRPLANLVEAGLIGQVSVFSLQLRIRQGGDPEQHRQELIRRVRDFRPNYVLMQHLGSTGLTAQHFKKIRAAAEFDFIYHEGDPYSRFLHPLPAAARAAGRFSDVTYTVGSNVFGANFRRSGAKDVRWAPSAFEPDRYILQPVSPLPVRSHDVVVVANRNSPRFRGHPNWRERIKFVTLLQECLGDRLAIYGKGWTGVGAMGPVDFSRQSEAIRSAWISANWDHYAKEARYFSNRLPISLATGTVHATTLHPGYREIFGKETRSFLLMATTPKQLVEKIEGHLKGSRPEDRIFASQRAQEYAYQNFRQDNQLIEFLNYRKIAVDPSSASQVWNLETAPLSEI